jgi:ArsR family transcriptional regulator, arsenate/arsenite/antimonite-responsive transcriptional repressor
MERGLKKVETFFKALADETRLRILKLLEGGELCVCDLTAALEMTQPNVSFHLGILKAAGLIKDRKEGRWSYYDLELSDMMARVVVPTALERMSGELVEADRKRLGEFQVCKNLRSNCCSDK